MSLDFPFPKRRDLALESIPLDESLSIDGKTIKFNRKVTINGWTLGLDVGSNSIGWMLVRDNPIPGERNLLGGVRVFPAATDQPKGPATETSRTVERRVKRGMRRQQQRRDRRRRRLLYELLRHGLLQLDLSPVAETGSYHSRDLMGYWQSEDQQFKDLIFKTDPYQLRAEGLDRQLTPAEFARCLIHLNQHRGFKSNRKTGGQSDGVVKQGIEKTKAGMKTTGSRTLGEYLFKLAPPQQKGENQPVSRKRGRYLHRDMILEEIKLLWDTQRDQFPHSPLSKLLTPDAWDAIVEKVILFQRPFDKVTEDRVGVCNWEPNEKRERRGHRLAHRFRILTEVDNLRFDPPVTALGRKGKIRTKPSLREETAPGPMQLALNSDDTSLVSAPAVKPGDQIHGLVADATGRYRLGSELRAKLLEHLTTHGELKLDKILSFLQLPDNWTVNLAQGNRPCLKGNATEITLVAAFSPQHVHQPEIHQWSVLTEDQRNQICKACLELEDDALAVKARSEWGMNDAGIAYLLDPKNTLGPDKHSMLSLKAIKTFLDFIDPQYGDPIKFADTLKAALYGSTDKNGIVSPPTSMVKVVEREVYGTVHRKNLQRHIYGLLPFPPGMEFSTGKAVDGKGAYVTPKGTWTDQATSSDKTVRYDRRKIESLDQIPKEGRPLYKVGDTIPTHLEYAERAIHGSLNGQALHDPLVYLEDRQPIMNPVVRKALFEVRKVVNEIIRSFGLPSKIRIELARDARGSIQERLDIIKNQRKNEAERKRIKKAIATDLKISEEAVRHTDIVAYQLWEEQDKRCIYTGKPISSYDLLRGDVQVDHIIPFSQSMDDSRANKVVALGPANRDKGNRTPAEWMAGNEAEYEAMLARVEGLRASGKWKSNKAKRFTREGAAEIAEDSPIIARKLVDTQYIARQLATYLSCLYPSHRKFVEIGRGDVTHAIRGSWELDSLLWELNGFDPSTWDQKVEKNRGDHRHHALDATIIALTSATTLQHYAWHKKQIAKQRREKNGNEKLSRQEREQFAMKLPWDGFRQELKNELARMVVSHTPTKRIRGPLHKETYYGPTSEPSTYVVTKPLTSLSPNMIASIVSWPIRRRVIDHLVAAGAATIQAWDSTANQRKPKDTVEVAYAEPHRTTHLLKIADKNAIAQSLNATDAGTLFTLGKPQERYKIVRALVDQGIADLSLETPEDGYWRMDRKAGFQKLNAQGEVLITTVTASVPSETMDVTLGNAPSEAETGENEEATPEVPKVPFGQWFEIPAVTEGTGSEKREISPRCFARFHDLSGGLDEEEFHKLFYETYPKYRPLAPWDGAPPIRHVRIHDTSNTVVPVVRSGRAESFVEPGNNHHVAMFRILIPEVVEDKDAMSAILATSGKKSWSKTMGPKPTKIEHKEIIHFEARTLLEAAREKLALLKLKKSERPKNPNQVLITQPKRHFDSTAHIELVGYLMMNDCYILSQSGDGNIQQHLVRLQKGSVKHHVADITFRDVRSVFVDPEKSLPGSGFRLTSLRPSMIQSATVDVLGRVSIKSSLS